MPWQNRSVETRGLRKFEMSDTPQLFTRGSYRMVVESHRLLQMEHRCLLHTLIKGKSHNNQSLPGCIYQNWLNDAQLFTAYLDNSGSITNYGSALVENPHFFVLSCVHISEMKKWNKEISVRWGSQKLNLKFNVFPCTTKNHWYALLHI